jgi:hypothetical protein
MAASSAGALADGSPLVDGTSPEDAHLVGYIGDDGALFSVDSSVGADATPLLVHESVLSIVGTVACLRLLLDWRHALS